LTIRNPTILRRRAGAFCPWQRSLIHLRNTFIGRLLVAPLLDIAQTLGSALAAFRHRRVNTIAMWLVHGLLLAALFAWMNHLGFSPLYFVLAISYPALALTKVRSFLEHRAADDPLARSVINEAGLVWRVLFSISTTIQCITICRAYRGTGCEKSICIIRRTTAAQRRVCGARLR
jgi:hypothetical protein